MIRGFDFIQSLPEGFDADKKFVFDNLYESDGSPTELSAWNIAFLLDWISNKTKNPENFKPQ